MDRSIYTYALIKSLYDHGHNYIDSFWPFAIKAIPTDRFASQENIQTALKGNFGLDIPLHVIGTILARAKGKGFLEQQRNKANFRLSEEGAKYLDKLESDKEVERRINALLEDLQQFLADNDLAISILDTNTLLTKFLRNNIRPLIEFLNPSVSNGSLQTIDRDHQTELLITYLQSVENGKPAHFKTLEEMIFGSLISVILYSPKPDGLKEKKFKHLTVYLDTNFVFSLYEFHGPAENKAAIELLVLLQQMDFDLKVFNFTVNEICRVIGKYPRAAQYYPTSIDIATIYQNLKLKGWTEITAKEFIVDIERTLAEKGIAIDIQNDLDLKQYTPEAHLIEAIARYKHFQSEFSQKHDLAAIKKIKEIRTKPVRQIERAGAIFLTSDGHLGRYDFIEMDHKANGTICEVILDKLFANILWLKDPTSELPIKTIISAYSRDLFVRRRVWDKFYEVLKQLKKEEKIDDDKISMLFYHKFIEGSLRELEEHDLNQITEDFVLEKVEEAARQSEEEMRKQKEQAQLAVITKEEELRRTLEEKVSETRSAKDKEWLSKIAISEKEWTAKFEEKEREFLQAIAGEAAKVTTREDSWIDKVDKVKKRLKDKSLRFAKTSVCIARISLLFLLASPFLLAAFNGDWLLFQRAQGILSVMLGIIGLVLGGYNGMWNAAQEKLAEKLYAAKVRDLVLLDGSTPS